MARQRKKVTFITPMTVPVIKAVGLVASSLETFGTFLDGHRATMHAPGAQECWETTKAYHHNMMEGIRVSQQGMSLFSRFQASHEAWKRGAKWATEERLTADAEAFASFVRCECRPLATVIPIAKGGA